jgi:hypothetical protein
MTKSVVTRMSLRSEFSKANQFIYGANSSVDDDVKCDKDYVEDREVPLISALNTGWSSKENIFPQLSHKDVETYLLKCRSDDNEKMSCYRQFIRAFNFYKENYIHDISFFLTSIKIKLFTLKHICFWICNIFGQISYIIYFLKCLG